MCEGDLIAVDAIVGHQQPAREALLNLAAAVGKRRRCGLHEERVYVTQKDMVQVDALRDDLAQVSFVELPEPLAHSFKIGVVSWPSLVERRQ